MKEHPILFSTPMVKAILEGKKTMTRRIVRFPKKFDGKIVFDNSPFGLKYSNGEDTVERLSCPYGLPGDLLWVRETFKVVSYPDGTTARKLETLYKADNPHEYVYGWKPSIFMPRAAARIILKIVSVKVERLQDISDEGALDEGMLPDRNYFVFGELNKAFRITWDEIHGVGSWDENPWVWVIEFERVK